MRLRRTPHERPDLTPEPRQPTCYDARDPLRPWLALDDEPPDDADDIQLARFMVEHGPIATFTPGDIVRREPAPPLDRPEHKDPGMLSLVPCPLPAASFTFRRAYQRSAGAGPLDELPRRVHYVAGHPPMRPERDVHHHETQQACGFEPDSPPIHHQPPSSTRPFGPMRFALEIEDHVAGRAQIRLLADDQGLIASTMDATEGEIRLLVDVPRWVDKRTVKEMLASGRYMLAAIEHDTQEST